jgi:hypothetical protein
MTNIGLTILSKKMYCMTSQVFRIVKRYQFLINLFSHNQSFLDARDEIITQPYA